VEKIVAQIAHGSAHSQSQFTGEEAMGPSKIPPQDGKSESFSGCRAMTQNDIDVVVNAFRLATIRAIRARIDELAT
jgi:2,4-dienoyl-CoA reductase-like NADH-dependent reductase (Old Yellow Enzyme family)